MGAKKSSNESACDERVLGVLERIATALERLSLDAPPVVPATRAHVEALGLSALQAAQVVKKEPPCPSPIPSSIPAPNAGTSEAVTTSQGAGSEAVEATLASETKSPSTGASSAPASATTSSTAALTSDPDSRPSALAEACTGSVVDLGEDDTRDVPTTWDLCARFPFEKAAELKDLRDFGLRRPGSERPDSVTIATVKRLVCQALCPDGDDAAKLAAWKAHVAKLDAAATPGTQVSGAPEVWKLCAIVWAVPVAQLDGSAVS